MEGWNGELIETKNPAGYEFEMERVKNFIPAAAGKKTAAKSIRL